MLFSISQGFFVPYQFLSIERVELYAVLRTEVIGWDMQWLFSASAPLYAFSSVQFSRSVMSDSVTGLPVHHQLLEFTKTHIHRVSDAIQPSHPLLAPSPSVPNPSQHQSLSNESTLLIRWPKYWSFTFSIIPSKENPGLTSFRMYWLDLLEVQGTHKSLLQHHSSKASILWRSALFTVQLSHPYIPLEKP